jgi:hypothetical protein
MILNVRLIGYWCLCCNLEKSIIPLVLPGKKPARKFENYFLNCGEKGNRNVYGTFVTVFLSFLIEDESLEFSFY